MRVISMRISFAILLIFLLFENVYGQEGYSYTFNDVELISALKQVEDEHEIRIYFVQEWFENANISGEFNATSVGRLLEMMLKDQDVSLLKYDPYTYIFLKELKKGQTVEHLSDNGEFIRKTVLGDAFEHATQGTISGYLLDVQDQTPLVGGTVYVDEFKKGVASDVNGYYEITLPVGEHTLEINSVGYNNEKIDVILQSDDNFDIQLVTASDNLEEVVITTTKEEVNVSEGQISRNVIKMKDIEFIPLLMGEKDVVKVLELSPGVNSAGEGSNGYSVRGGNAGQNLIFLENAPVYNSSHLFGFFSVFNPGVVESAVIYKGVTPPQYGGRVSSVMDVKLKKSSPKKLGGELGLGMVSSRLHLEGSLKEKVHVLAGGRVSHVNSFLDKLENFDVRQSQGAFYDLNTRLTYDRSDKTKLTFNGFVSRDEFTLPAGDRIDYGNRIASIKWDHIYNESTTLDFNVAYSGYFSTINSRDSLETQYVENGISTVSAKGSLSIFTKKNQRLNVGFEGIYTQINPGSIDTFNPFENTSTQIEKEQGIEPSLFASNEITLSDRITLNVGFRYSSFFLLGPGTEYGYLENGPKRLSTLSDSTQYAGGDIIKAYSGFEPRIFLKYALDNTTSFNLNFGRSRQYNHLVSNSASVSPLSIWKLSDQHLEPQIADQVAVGFKKNFDKPIEITTEIFYRRIQNLPDYKNGAELLTNPNLERALVSGLNNAYGLEFLLTKKGGRLFGWMSYTYSRSLNRFDSPIPEDAINDGAVYPSDNDRPHAVSISGDYLFSRVWSLSFNWVFNSGRPATFPETIYYDDDIQVAHFSQRNEHRIPDYHRLDLSLNFKGSSLKKERKWDLTWSLSLYNVYGRANAYSIFFERERELLWGRKLAILAEPVPSISVLAKF